MRSQKGDKTFLLIITLIGILLLPFAIVKRSFKDWIIVYLVSVLGNSLADHYLVTRGYLKYKIRPMPKIFSIHLPFDLVHYPLALLYYNQWTLNSNLKGILLKLFPFIIPQIIFETMAAKKTNLIHWRRGWSWYHSFFAMAGKFLICRSIIAIIRIINNKAVTTRDL
ncbi:CBO0543 family protein [Niallia sp. XMNu-256]|uniref:CBO0543 family protein n=1 Tax=Niallia sp. XMNu-256 TaxID=3082444 RepID=UPI0030CD3E41